MGGRSIFEGRVKRVAVVLAIWLAGLGAAGQFGKIGVLYPQLAKIYAADSAIAFMVSLVGAAGLVFGTTAGLLVQGFGCRRVIVWALWAGAAISLLHALMPPLPVMLASRVVEGFAHLAIVVAGPVLIAQAGGVRHQGLVMTLWGTIFGVAFAVLGWFGPAMAAFWGVPGLFVGHAVFMAVVALILGRLLAADVRVKQGAAFDRLWARHRAIYASPSISAPAMGFVFYTLCYVALLTLLPPMMPGGFGPMVAALMPLTSIVVSMTLGVWALRVISAVALVQGGFSLGLLAALGLWVVLGNAAATVAAALVLAAAMGLVQGASFNAIPQLNANPNERAQAAGAVAQLGNLGSTSGTPILAFCVASWGLAGVVYYVAPVCLAGIWVHVWLMRRRMRPGLAD